MLRKPPALPGEPSLEPRILVFPEGYFQSDPELGFDLAPNRPPARMRFRGPGHFAFTNSFACFDWERRVEPGYVLAIGDSMTWGWAALEEKWTSLLEDRMGRQVVKCGVPGTGTRYQALKMKRTIEKIGFPPSIVIWLYIDNDFNDDVGFPTDTAVGG